MDIKISLRYLLSNTKDTFTLEGPCVCCGKPNVGVWTYKNDYKLERWGADSSGKPAKQGYKDKDGNAAQGEIELNLPYCSEHLNQSKRLRKYHGNQGNGMVIAGVIAIVLYFILFGVDWMRDAETNIQMGFRMCAMPIIAFIGGAGLVGLAMKSINESKANQPEFIDYPINSDSGGGSGLAIRVGSEQSGRVGQFVGHFLFLDFKNIEAAKQFKQKYPESIISKGKELLEL